MGLIEAAGEARVRALSAGALVPITMEGDTIGDGGVFFRVEWVSALAMKDLAAKVPRAGDKGGPVNPFLPYEPDLHVADISPRYVALLNKFPAVPGHLLAVTKAFAEQEGPLSADDFAVAAMLAREVGGLTFYNSGPVAGASQRHRHFQAIPGFQCPMAALFPARGTDKAIRRVPDVPFAHAFVRFDPTLLLDHAKAGAAIAAWFTEACERLGIGTARAPGFNLLLTEDWLLVVPRRVERVADISLSALGYAGLIALRRPEDIEIVRRHGPMNMLLEASGGQ